MTLPGQISAQRRYWANIDSLLDDAVHASSSEWEVDFTSDQLERRLKYDDNFSLTDAQLNVLCRIADLDPEDYR